MYWTETIQVVIQCLTKILTGPVTDYTSSMVPWMRHRQPRYKGGARMEFERPSASYIVDVRLSYRIHMSDSKTMIFTYGLDSPTSCNTWQSSGCNSGQASAFFSQQAQASYQHSTMDPRRSKAVDRFKYWRVHAVEWNGFQL